MEEVGSRSTNQNDSSIEEKKSIIKRILYIFFKFLKYGFYVATIYITIYFFWSMTEFIYDRMIGSNVDETGTKDYYEIIEKKEPLATYQLPSVKVELQPKTQQEVGAIVSMGIVLGFDPANVSLTKEIQQREIQINDILRHIIIRKVYRDFENTDRLNELEVELQNAINTVLVNGKIADIYFEDFNVVKRP